MNHEAVLAMCTRYQQHLTICAQTISREQVISVTTPSMAASLLLLFLLLIGSRAGSLSELRDLVAGIILSQPLHYSTAVLSRPNENYASWISRGESWGGMYT